MGFRRASYKKARKKHFLEGKDKRSRKKKKRKNKGFSWLKDRRTKGINKRLNKDQKAFKARKGAQNRHHIFARSLGGGYEWENIIWLDERRHSAFHLLFGLRTFAEAAELLLRAHRAKTGEDHTMASQMKAQCAGCTKWCKVMPLDVSIPLPADMKKEILNLNGGIVKCDEGGAYFVKNIQAQICPN